MTAKILATELFYTLREIAPHLPEDLLGRLAPLGVASTERTPRSPLFRTLVDLLEAGPIGTETHPHPTLGQHSQRV